MHKRISWSSLATASILALASVSQVTAQMLPAPPRIPLTYAVKYWTHADPNDPNSPVKFEFEVTLINEDSDGDQIGWDISKISVREYDPNGEVLRAWSQDDPNVPTPDGLWWVTHADPQTPDRGDFLLPPHLVGTAAAADSAYADLDYDIEGVESNPPPLYEVTAGLDYLLVEEGESEPTGGGQDEPVDVPPEEEDPGS